MPQTIRRALLWGVLALIALGFFGPAGAGDTYADPPPKVHPAVDVFAEQNPGEMIPVIVQASGDPHGLADRVQARGGVVIEELGIIDGFAALVPPEEAERLGQDADVTWVSLDAVVIPTHGHDEIDASDLATAYPFAANAVSVWEEGVTGDGVTVALIDTGVAGERDFQDRIIRRFEFTSLTNNPVDRNGHGTFVAGVIGGLSDGYIGIAPQVDFISLKVAGREGYALVSDVVEALQWTVDHKDDYNIRVINLSLTSTIADTYRLDPLDAAVEQAWFQGIVVVTAAGNWGTDPFSADHAPANDPFVITVGALDDGGTRDWSDDALASWSSRGVTVEGYTKPEVVAPGVEIVSTLSSPGSYLARNIDGAMVDRQHLRLSGTSASAAVVSGVVALMLEQEPSLTPDQVKFRLMAEGAPLDSSEAPRVAARGTVFSQVTGQANQNALPSELIDPETGEIMYNSVLWRSVLWRSVLWRSVLWRSVLPEN